MIKLKYKESIETRIKNLLKEEKQNMTIGKEEYNKEINKLNKKTVNLFNYNKNIIVYTNTMTNELEFIEYPGGVAGILPQKPEMFIRWLRDGKNFLYLKNDKILLGDLDGNSLDINWPEDMKTLIFFTKTFDLDNNFNLIYLGDEGLCKLNLKTRKNKIITQNINKEDIYNISYNEDGKALILTRDCLDILYSEDKVIEYKPPYEYGNCIWINNDKILLADVKTEFHQAYGIIDIKDNKYVKYDNSNAFGWRELLKTNKGFATTGIISNTLEIRELKFGEPEYIKTTNIADEGQYPHSITMSPNKTLLAYSIGRTPTNLGKIAEDVFISDLNGNYKQILSNAANPKWKPEFKLK